MASTTHNDDGPFALAPAKKGKSKKRSRQEDDELDLAEERRLTALLFGTAGEEATIEHDEEEAIQATTASTSDSPKVLFHLDRTGVSQEEEEETSLNDNEDNDLTVRVDSSPQEASAAGAWVDDDDDGPNISLMKGASRIRKLRKFKNETTPLNTTEYQERLRQVHSNTSTVTTSWAKLVHTSTPQEDYSSSTRSLLAGSCNRLKPNILNVVRCRNANESDVSHAVVRAVHFHPTCAHASQPLLLTAGLDKTLRFFQLSPDGKHKKIHGIHFPKLPIYSARFLGDTGKVVVSGRRSFYYIYDTNQGHLECIPKLLGRSEKSLEKMTTAPNGQYIAFVGNDGHVLIVSIQNPQVVMGSCKLNGSVRAICFTSDSQSLYASGSDGQVYKYNVATQDCEGVFSNDDGTITSSIGTSPQQQQVIAVGAESGIVNLYNHNHASPNLQKTITNLQTSVDHMTYNHDGQVLAMGTTRDTNGNFKLLHTPTNTIFSNWPTSKTPLGRPWCMDFSPFSHYMAIGNDKGKCLLYKLLHYSSQEE